MSTTAAFPESFIRRRSRAGSFDATTINEFPAIQMDSKSCPLSPMQKSSCLYGSHSDRTSHRDAVYSEGECEMELADTHVAEKQSLFRDLCQTQLSLWTFTVSTLLTYFWQKRVNFKSVLFVACAFTTSIFLSWLLAGVVMAAHLFNSDFAESFGGFNEWISGDDDNKYPNLVRRQSSSFRHRAAKRRNSGMSSGSTTPRGGDKFHQTRFWQKNVASLDRTSIGSSRS